MTPTWFHTSARLEALYAEALSWEGTPFFINGEAKGPQGGAACHKMVPLALMNVGALPRRPIPEGHPNVAGQLRLARLGRTLASWPEFATLPAGEPTLPGDVITFRAHVGEWHLGLRIPDHAGQQLCFLHMVPRYGASIGNLLDPTYDTRAVSAWRVRP